MNETMMTICGNLVEAPRLRRTKSGHSVASFRVASTPRRFDREQGQWVDGDTLFVSVTAWRALGENLVRSLDKGHPVVVHGRYYQREYLKDDLPRTAYELEALAVGHDLSRGVSTYERVTRSANPSFGVDDNGATEDLTGDYLGAADDAAQDLGADLAGVDLETGEVRELTPA